jgi:hypothetical protein
VEALGWEPDQTTMSFYERVYFGELEMREKIVARMQVPLAIILSLFGALSYMCLAIDFSKRGWVWYMFIVLMAVGVWFAARAARLLFQVLSGHAYRFMPSLLEYEDFRRASIAKFRDVEGAEQWLDSWVMTTMNREITRQFVTCSSYNAGINVDRSTRSWKAHTLLLRSGIITALAFVLFYLGELKEVPIYKVELVAVPADNTNHKVEIVRPLFLASVPASLRLHNEK